MRITIQNEEVVNLATWQENVIKNDIIASFFDSDMQRRASYIVEHPIERFIDQNKEEWRKSLQRSGVTEIPSNRRQLLSFVIQRPEFNLDDPSINSSLQVKYNNNNSFQISPETRKILKKENQRDDKEVIHSKINWILQHKFERCMERLRREWEPKLEGLGVENIPISDEDFANLVFARPEYKDRETRDQEASIQ